MLYYYINHVMGNALGSLSFICSDARNNREIINEVIMDDIKRDIHIIKENHLPHLKEDIVQIKMDIKIMKDNIQDIKIMLINKLK